MPPPSPLPSPSTPRTVKAQSPGAGDMGEQQTEHTGLSGFFARLFSRKRGEGADATQHLPQRRSAPRSRRPWLIVKLKRLIHNAWHIGQGNRSTRRAFALLRASAFAEMKQKRAEQARKMETASDLKQSAQQHKQQALLNFKNARKFYNVVLQRSQMHSDDQAVRKANAKLAVTYYQKGVVAAELQKYGEAYFHFQDAHARNEDGDKDAELRDRIQKNIDKVRQSALPQICEQRKGLLNPSIHQHSEALQDLLPNDAVEPQTVGGEFSGSSPTGQNLLDNFTGWAKEATAQHMSAPSDVIYPTLLADLNRSYDFDYIIERADGDKVLLSKNERLVIKPEGNIERTVADQNLADHDLQEAYHKDWFTNALGGNENLVKRISCLLHQGFLKTHLEAMQAIRLNVNDNSELGWVLGAQHKGGYFRVIIPQHEGGNITFEASSCDAPYSLFLLDKGASLDQVDPYDPAQLPLNTATSYVRTTVMFEIPMQEFMQGEFENAFLAEPVKYTYHYDVNWDQIAFDTNQHPGFSLNTRVDQPRTPQITGRSFAASAYFNAASKTENNELLEPNERLEKAARYYGLGAEQILLETEYDDVYLEAAAGGYLKAGDCLTRVNSEEANGFYQRALTAAERCGKAGLAEQARQKIFGLAHAPSAPPLESSSS